MGYDGAKLGARTRHVPGLQLCELLRTGSSNTTTTKPPATATPSSLISQGSQDLIQCVNCPTRKLQRAPWNPAAAR